jgi:hypothetical protein
MNNIGEHGMTEISIFLKNINTEKEFKKKIGSDEKFTFTQFQQLKQLLSTDYTWEEIERLAIPERTLYYLLQMNYSDYTHVQISDLVKLGRLSQKFYELFTYEKLMNKIVDPTSKFALESEEREVIMIAGVIAFLFILIAFQKFPSTLSFLPILFLLLGIGMLLVIIRILAKTYKK